MNCADIGKKLQPFLEDLLIEEECRAFCDHLDACDTCKAYVRSIGSFSNQLWKLGQIEVPEDLISTIQYKILHPEEKGPPAKIQRSGKRIAAAAVLLTLLTVVLLGGIAYLIKRRHFSGRNDAPTVRTEVIRTFEPLPDNEAEVLFGRLEAIAEKLGVSEKEHAAGGEAGQESSGD